METGCGSVSESADCLTMVTQKRLHSTGIEPGDGRCESPACLRNPKGWNKALAVRTNKGGTGWIFKELLGCTTLWATERKM